MNAYHKSTTGDARLRLPVTLIMLLLAVAAPAAMADDDSRLSLSLGLFVTDWDTKTRVDADEVDAGTSVDLEDDLGLDSSNSVFRLDGSYKFAQRHRADFSVFSFSRSSQKTIEKEIDWKGNTYPIDTSVAAESDLKVYKLAYTYSLITSDKGYLGATGGLYVADLSARLSAESIGERSGGDVTAPLPVLGMRGEYRLSDKWSFRASGEFFFLSYDQYDGSLTDLYAGVDYRLFKRASVGIGLNSVRLNIGVSGDNLNGDFDWQYDGGLLFVKFDF